jgi:hypothetical protein
MTLVLLDNEHAKVVNRVPQGEARREATLRDLIADHPGLLPVHDLDPSYGRLVTVTKELSIPGVGFVDVLLTDETGRLVVVECKLWRNPQARREVVGQILDYARELSRYSYEDLQRQVAIATHRRGNVLFDLAREAGGVLDEAEFVDRVSRDLRAGRFLLLVVGDGITEGTRRIGEYLRDQPGLAFTFGLIEMAEYRVASAGDPERTIIQPRVLAQTSLIERHVIRSEVPGLVIDAVEQPLGAVRPGGAGSPARSPSDAAQRFRIFLDRFIAEVRFDDPGQPPPRYGGTNWIKVPLPDDLYVNVYRSAGTGNIGGEVRFPSSEARQAYEVLASEHDGIDAEFTAAGLGAPTWTAGEVPNIALKAASPAPWREEEEQRQREWMARVANQFVNSLRPRLQRLARELAA